MWVYRRENIKPLPLSHAWIHSYAPYDDDDDDEVDDEDYSDDVDEARFFLLYHLYLGNVEEGAESKEWEKSDGDDDDDDEMMRY